MAYNRERANQFFQELMDDVYGQRLSRRCDVCDRRLITYTGWSHAMCRYCDRRHEIDE